MQQDLRSNHLGLIVVLTLLLTAGALFQDVRFDQSLSAGHASLVSVEREIGSLDVSLSDLRAAQTGYLATGQGPDFWMRRATELFASIGSGLTQLKDATTAPGARPRYEAALEALAGLSGMDKRARDQIQGDQHFLAADLIFADSLDGTQRLRTELAEARDAEARAAEGHSTAVSRYRLALNAGTLAMMLLLAVYAARPQAQAAAPSPAATMAQMLRDLPPPVKPAAPPARAPAPPPPVVPALTVSLPDAAELCVDLARVIDSRDVPSLLERTAAVLDAKGVIIWLLDGEGGLLRPSLTHGYPSKVLSKLGGLAVDSDNVTSLCFRSARPQMMPGAGPGAAGALAVPLMAASGCTGVLAAEIRDSKPGPEMLALARIIAAQFATLIGPGEAGSARAAQA